MSKKEKLIARLLTFPKDFSYNEMKTLLGYLGFEEDNKGATSGSRVQFIKDEHTILLHKPHPGNQLKPYQVKNVVIELRNLKLI